MSRTFELETLKMRLSDPEFRPLDLHQRIQRALRGLILDGALGPGVKLPATRALAKSLAVSRDTVENAYVQLQRDGFVLRRKGSGSYVCETIGAQLRGPSRRRQLQQGLPAHSPEPGAGLSRRGAALLARGGVSDQQAVTAFATGLPETRSFPLEVWERLQRQALKDYRASVLLHGDPQGALPLRKAIAAYLNLERGAKVQPEQILVLSSTRQALFLCAQLLVDAGKPILMENPGYFGARKAFEAAEARIVPIDVDGQGIRTDLLRADRSGARCVYVTPSHQYPTGATLSLERRLELTRWAAEHDRWIIEDDYDSEFHYAGRPTACVQGLDVHERTLYIGTFTKSLFPGLRIGYMVLPPALVAPMTVARSLQDGHNASLAQLTLARFIAGGHFGAYVRGMRNLYGERLGFLAERVGKRLGGLVEPRVPAGGLQMPGLLCAEIDETRAIAAAYRAGVELVGLSALHLAAPPRAGFLMGFAAYTTDELEAAVGVLAKTLRGLRANP